MTLISFRDKSSCSNSIFFFNSLQVNPVEWQLYNRAHNWQHGFQSRKKVKSGINNIKLAYILSILKCPNETWTVLKNISNMTNTELQIYTCWILLNMIQYKPLWLSWKLILLHSHHTKLIKDLQKSLDGYREPRRIEYLPFLFCKNFFILNVKQRAACWQPICLLKCYIFRKNPRTSQTERVTNSKQYPILPPWKPQQCPHKQKVSVHGQRVQSLCECVNELVLFPDSSSGRPACTVLIRKLGRGHPGTSVPS